MKAQEAIQGLKNLFSEHELDLPHTDSLEILEMAMTETGKDCSKCIWNELCYLCTGICELIGVEEMEKDNE